MLDLAAGLPSAFPIPNSTFINLCPMRYAIGQQPIKKIRFHVKPQPSEKNKAFNLNFV
jgi:hypothetical protein